jgi:hypothetical protein
MHTLNSLIKWPKNVGYFSNIHIAAQSKQSPIERTFAQSGHPVALAAWRSEHRVSLRDSRPRLHRWFLDRSAHLEV